MKPFCGMSAALKTQKDNKSAQVPTGITTHDVLWLQALSVLAPEPGMAKFSLHPNAVPGSAMQCHAGSGMSTLPAWRKRLLRRRMAATLDPGPCLRVAEHNSKLRFCLI